MDQQKEESTEQALTLLSVVLTMAKAKAYVAYSRSVMSCNYHSNQNRDDSERGKGRLRRKNCASLGRYFVLAEHFNTCSSTQIL